MTKRVKVPSGEDPVDFLKIVGIVRRFERKYPNASKDTPTGTLLASDHFEDTDRPSLVDRLSKKYGTRKLHELINYVRKETVDEE